jgi:hypothetical protein
MSKIDEIKQRIEQLRNESTATLCPKCDKEDCGCYKFGEFWDMQRKEPPMYVSSS